MGWLAPDHPALEDIPPMPEDFAPQLLHDHRSVRWRGRVDGGVMLEIGFSTKTHADAEEKTRLAVWHVQQLAKLERHEHLVNARADRHSKRPQPKAPPSLPPAPPKTVAIEP